MSYRVTGLGAFGYSINWEKLEGDGDIARRVIIFLEDRRLLFQPYLSITTVSDRTGVLW